MLAVVIRSETLTAVVPVSSLVVSRLSVDAVMTVVQLMVATVSVSAVVVLPVATAALLAAVDLMGDSSRKDINGFLCDRYNRNM